MTDTSQAAWEAEGPKGHDVFVSYSRADRATVVEITRGLERRGKRSWVDLDDIPPSAEWMAEIHAAIDAADGYLVVLSPALAASEVCGQELEHAREAGKRIVPLLVSPTDPSSVPATLAGLHWIDAVDGGLDDTLDRVVEALETDLGYVKAHTRLLVRASEWERSGEDRSLLLRGRELGDAETTLADPDAEPRPTQLQTRYVLASRRASGRRQRAGITAVAAALVVALALSAVALVQRGQAVEQRAVAEERAAESRSRELAASSSAQLANDPELSLLLAIEAARIEPTTQAEQALRKAITSSNVEALIDAGAGKENAMTGVAVSPDGASIAASDRNGEVRIWDAETGGQLGALVGHQTGIEERNWVESVAFSTDGSLIATAGRDGTARVWDAATSEQLLVLEHDKWAFDARFSRNGSTLVTASADETVRLWDVRTGRSISTIEGGGWIYAADLSRDGRRVVTGSDGGVVSVWDARTGRKLLDLVGHDPEGGAVLDVAFSADGRTIASTGEDETLRLWDSRSGEVLQSLPHDGSLEAVSFPPAGARDDQLLVTAGVQGGTIWDTQAGLPVAQLRGHELGASGVDWFPDASRVVTASLDGTIRIWNTGVALDFEQVADDVAWSAPFSPDGGRVAIVDGSRKGGVSVRTWPLDGTDGVALDHEAAWWMDWAPDGRSVATVGWDGRTRIWDSETGEPEQTLRANDRTLYSGDFDATGERFVTASDDGRTRVWDVRSGEVVSMIESADIANHATFDPSGARVATASEDGFVTVSDASTGEMQLEIDQGGPSSLAVFDPGGTRLATAQQSTVKLWNATTGDQIGQLLGHRGVVYWAVFSPDGDLLLTAAQDGTARLWDTRSGQEILVLRADPFWVTSAQFTPDGEDILTTGLTSGGVRIYPCSVCGSLDNLVAAAEGQLTRELTPEERATYLGESTQG